MVWSVSVWSVNGVVSQCVECEWCVHSVCGVWMMSLVSVWSVNDVFSQCVECKWCGQSVCGV